METTYILLKILKKTILLPFENFFQHFLAFQLLLQEIDATTSDFQIDLTRIKREMQTSIKNTHGKEAEVKKTTNVKEAQVKEATVAEDYSSTCVNQELETGVKSSLTGKDASPNMSKNVSPIIVKNEILTTELETGADRYLTGKDASPNKSGNVAPAIVKTNILTTEPDTGTESSLTSKDVIPNMSNSVALTKVNTENLPTELDSVTIKSEGEHIKKAPQKGKAS